MSPRVTAIIVVHDGTGPAASPRAHDPADDQRHLRRTLDAVAAQTRRPDTVIVVACATPEAELELVRRAVPDRIVTSNDRLSFGQAVAAGLRVAESPTSDDDFLWLLAQDTAPEPDALARLVGSLEVSPSVAVAAPKNVDWPDGSTLVSFGQSMTPFGTTVELVENELDQGQHDTASDVLGAAPAGLLVRHRVWDEVGGFDPGLPTTDDGLDFSTRVRLAGHRVALVPDAVILTAGDGVAGPNRSTRAHARRRRARAARTAQLHRRLVYAPAAVVWLHWLSLVPLAVLRAIWRLLSKTPEFVGGELAAAFVTAFGGTKVLAARKRLKNAKTVGWSSVQPLRLPFAEVRRRRRLSREAGQVVYTVERSELRFFSGGAAWVVLASALAGVIAFFSLLPATALQGGGLLPLSEQVPQLWQHIGYGWRDIGLGFIGAADPFSAVLAVLGSITFWEPSYALVLLWLLAFPLATLGAWFAATRLTERSGYRIFAAIVWTLAPTFLSSLADGRPAAVLVHLLLPWLFYVGAVVARSWASAGTASLLLAATVAAAPSLAPAMVVLWVLALVLSRKAIVRVVWTIIPTAALFAPLVWQQGIVGGNWLRLLADPGLPIVGPQPTGWQLALGFPAGDEGGWLAFGESLGLPAEVLHILVPVLLAPLALLALAALFLPGSVRAAVLLFVGLLGLVTAVGASHLMLTFVGSFNTSVWAGPALSLYWIGLVGAAVVGLDSLRRAGRAPAVVSALMLAAVAVPLVAAGALGTSVVQRTDGRTLPAYVAAAAAQEPRAGTLILTPQPDGGLAAQLVRGAGETLDRQSTIVSTDPVVEDDDLRLATLAGNLVSQSGYDLRAGLAENGIRFILVAPPATNRGESATTRSEELRVRAISALDGNAQLAHVGETGRGMLWRNDGEASTGPAPETTPLWSNVVLIGTGVVFLIALLLSIPTAASRRATESTPRTVGRRDRIRPERRRRRAKEPAVDATEVGVTAAGTQHPEPIEVAAEDLPDDDRKTADHSDEDRTAEREEHTRG